MKKLYFTLIVIGSALLSSCDSYLDIQPVGKVIPNTLAEYRALLTTAYSIKLSDRAVTELRTDIAMVTDISSARNIYADIETWNDMSPKDGTREFIWDSYYKIIYHANAIITNQNEITEGDQESVEQLVGEAYLLRGYMHFLLVNLYGQPYTKDGAMETKAIPIKWDLDLEATPSRNTVKEVYAAILSDIESAQRLINQKIWEDKYVYRFSTLSVEALKSRVYLYMGDWSKAFEAAEQVLSEKSVLEDLNDVGAKLPNDYLSKEMITAYEFFSSDVTSASLAMPSFIQKHEAGKDLRIEKFYSLNNKGQYVISKSINAQYSCPFRIGELYLNAAEAAAHIEGKLPEARIRLLQLMEKRYTSEGYERKKAVVNAMNQTDLITEILEERARELAFEGHRWYDLRRTTRPRIEKLLGEATHVLGQDDSRYTLRIPQSAIKANPGLLD